MKSTRQGYYTVLKPDGTLLTKPGGGIRQVTTRDEAYERIDEYAQECEVYGDYILQCPNRCITIDNPIPEDDVGILVGAPPSGAVFFGFGSEDASGINSAINSTKTGVADSGLTPVSVTSGANSGTGTLREALATGTNKHITIDPGVTTITLTSNLSPTASNFFLDLGGATVWCRNGSVYMMDLNNCDNFVVYNGRFDRPIEEFDYTDINTSTNRITITGHSMNDGEFFLMSSTGSLPSIPDGSWNNGKWIEVIDANTIELYQNVERTTIQGMTSQGSGTMRLQTEGDGDELRVRSCNLGIIDHCSFWRASDGAIDITAGTADADGFINTDISVTNCILAEAVVASLIKYGPHRRLTIARNLFAHNEERNPQTRHKLKVMDYRNNFVYAYGLYGFREYARDLGETSYTGADNDGTVDYNLVGNVFDETNGDGAAARGHELVDCDYEYYGSGVNRTLTTALTGSAETTVSTVGVYGSTPLGSYQHGMIRVATDAASYQYLEYDSHDYVDGTTDPVTFTLATSADFSGDNASFGNATRIPTFDTDNTRGNVYVSDNDWPVGATIPAGTGSENVIPAYAQNTTLASSVVDAHIVANVGCTPRDSKEDTLISEIETARGL